jgi:hypothetical protein
MAKSRKRSTRKKSRSPKRSPKRSLRRSSKRKSSNRVIPPLRKGELKQFGYSSSNSVASRHRSLAKAIREYGDLSVFRKVNVLYVFNKNKNPTLASKFNSDKAWIKRTYMT